MEAEEAPEDDNNKHLDIVMQRLKEEGEKLSSARKKRGKKPPAELVDAGTLSNYVVQTNYPGLHSASVPGFLLAFFNYFLLNNLCKRLI